MSTPEEAIEEALEWAGLEDGQAAEWAPTVVGCLRAHGFDIVPSCGWMRIDDQRAKSSGDILLHLNTGHDGDGTISWTTVIGRWEGQWNGSGLKNMGPRYWSPIPTTPEHLRKSTT